MTRCRLSMIGKDGEDRAVETDAASLMKAACAGVRGGRGCRGSGLRERWRCDRATRAGPVSAQRRAPGIAGDLPGYLTVN
jgi:hypothetical protein